MSIPRRLIRTVPEQTSDEVERFWTSAQALHPTWHAVTLRDPLDPADFPLTSRLWDRCRTGAQKAGLIRLEALLHLGGVYLDSDVEPFRPMDALLGCRAFAGWEDDRTVPDAVLGAEAWHPAIDACLLLACASVENGEGPWESGPGVTTAVLPGRPDVLLLPPGSFYPVHYTQRPLLDGFDRASAPWAFGMHRWHASWLPPDMRR